MNDIAIMHLEAYRKTEVKVYEGLKKALNAHETGRELDDNEKRLKHNERYIIT